MSEILAAQEAAFAIWAPQYCLECEIKGHDWKETFNIWYPKQCQRCELFYQLPDY